MIRIFISDFVKNSFSFDNLCILSFNMKCELSVSDIVSK